MYVETEDVRRLGEQFTETKIDEPMLEDLIEQASRIFDLTCGLPPQFFEPVASTDTAASPRTFYGDGTNFLRLDPYLAGSLDTTITLPDGYTAPEFVERNGYLVRSSSGVLPNRYAPCGWAGWSEGLPITVSAKWGYDSTPADVKNAIVELVINLFRETDPAALKLVDIQGQPLRERIPPRVGEIAKRYRYKGVAFV